MIGPTSDGRAMALSVGPSRPIKAKWCSLCLFLAWQERGRTSSNRAHYHALDWLGTWLGIGCLARTRAVLSGGSGQDDNFDK